MELGFGTLLLVASGGEGGEGGGGVICMSRSALVVAMDWEVPGSTTAVKGVGSAAMVSKSVGLVLFFWPCFDLACPG